MHLVHRKSNKTVQRIVNLTTEGGLPKTGQIDSIYPGDDGAYKMGYPLEGERFINNADGTIVDTATGLMWVKDLAEAGLADRMYWHDAVDACENLEFAGHNDWRLPNINELMSFLDYSKYAPAWDPVFFGIPPDLWVPFWSSTNCASWIDGAWCIYPYDGYKSTWGIPWDMCYVRPVRGGQS